MPNPFLFVTVYAKKRRRRNKNSGSVKSNVVYFCCCSSFVGNDIHQNKKEERI